MDDLGEALQAFYKARARSAYDVGIDAVDLVQFECCYAAPVGTRIDGIDVTTVHGIFCENDELRVGTDDCFVGHLGKSSAAGIIVKDIQGICILQEFIAK